MPCRRQDFQRALLTTDAAAKYALGDTLAALLPLCGAPYRKATYMRREGV